MGLIEQASKRLEELRRAGIEVPVAVGGDENLLASQQYAPSIPERAALAQVGESGLFKRVGADHDGEKTTQAPAKEQRQSKVVEIDLQKLAAAGYVTPTSPRSQLADELRVIKRPLIANARDRSAGPLRSANLIMITSAAPGEGKTFIAINLAISIAMELDTTVLLVDADVARPAIPARLGLPQERGLLDLLTEKDQDAADVMLRTNIERLSILPAGTPHSRATELLASEAMNRLVEELAGRYPDRILVFDAPPLLASTECRALATHMGQIVVVVEADRTPQGTVSQALTTVENCPVVMTVLNKVPRSGGGSSYGNYGYYGYGQ